MKATRADVAKLAGVSTATVSYVLNGSRNVSEKSRGKVLQAVNALQYKPDMIARSMKMNETRQLSLMLNDISNPFYGEIVMGFENAAMSKGYFVNVCTGYKNLNSYFDNYVARRIDGVFIVAIPPKFEIGKLYDLVNNGARVVISGNTNADLKWVSAIECDYMNAMRKAVDHLRGLGHERIAYLSGLRSEDCFDQRIEGYKCAMEEAQLTCAEELLMEGKTRSTNLQDGFELTRELLTSGRKFTSIICTNDLMAMGSIAALEDFGLRVPDDVSVIGFDDNVFSQFWRPSITSMSMNKFEFGAKAFDLLYTNIKKDTTGYYLNKLELKIRDSTGIRR